jgi:hypothetical protein
VEPPRNRSLERQAGCTPAQIAAQIRDFAADPDILRSARSLKLPSLLVAIGILARHSGTGWASRVADAIFKGLAHESVATVITDVLARQPPFSRNGPR